jgi:hypothetical protein
MFQEQGFSTLTSDAVEAFMANYLAVQKIAGTEEQKERHEHWRIEGASTEIVAKHGGSHFLRVTAGVVIRGPVVIEMITKMLEEFLNRGFPIHL